MTTTHAEEARRDALVERLFGATIGAFDSFEEACAALKDDVSHER